MTAYEQECLDKYDRGEEGSILSEPTINAIDKIESPKTVEQKQPKQMPKVKL